MSVIDPQRPPRPPELCGGTDPSGMSQEEDAPPHSPGRGEPVTSERQRRLAAGRAGGISYAVPGMFWLLCRKWAGGAVTSLCVVIINSYLTRRPKFREVKEPEEGTLLESCRLA